MTRQDEIKHCEYMIKKIKSEAGKTDTFFGITSIRTDTSEVYKKRLAELNAITDKEFESEKFRRQYA